MIASISPKELLQNSVRLYFRPSIEVCSCGNKLNVYKTKKRGMATLLTGDCKANITQLICKNCEIIYSPEELNLIIPKNSYFGFDVIVYIGIELFVNHRNDEKIKQLLNERNISISLREISYLGKCFIAYLALSHKACQDEIKSFMNKSGGYILHLDGTCEGRSPHLFSFVDELSSIVLDNIKIPSETYEKIKPALEKIKNSYGDPIAIVRDMSWAIGKSVDSVFPNVQEFICHLHFLRDIGKDIFLAEYDFIRICLKKYKVRTILRNMSKKLRVYIEKNSDLKKEMRNCTKKNYFDGNHALMPPVIALYLLLTWILDSRSKSHGYGFPFDRPHVDFYDRLRESYGMIENLNSMMPIDTPKLCLAVVKRTLNDISLSNSILLIKERMPIFDGIRDAMRIAPAENKDGLNDDGGDVKLKTIESSVRLFRESEKVRLLPKNDIRFKKMLKQIDKYWGKLFADPIEVITDAGIVLIQPQRTNNLLERFFRKIKSGCRKKSGTSSLTKTLTTMMANTPLVKNLNIPEYLEIILNGKTTLAERFAEIDVASVRAMLQEEGESARKHPKGVGKILRIEDFPNRIEQIARLKCA